jgi:hypothetical protein
MERGAAKKRRKRAIERGDEVDEDEEDEDQDEDEEDDQGDEDEEEEEEDVPVPQHQLSDHLITLNGPGLLDRPRIKGRHLALPNGFIVIMPAVIESTPLGVKEAIELQRMIDECWENSLLPTSTKDDEWIRTPQPPYILAGAHLRPNAISLESLKRRSSLSHLFGIHVKIPGSELRVGDLLDQCRAGPSQSKILSTTVFQPIPDDPVVGDQQTADEGERRLFDEGISYGEIERDGGGLNVSFDSSSLRGFHVLATAGSLDRGLMVQGAGLMMRIMYGTRLLVVDGEELVLAHAGDEV